MDWHPFLELTPANSEEYDLVPCLRLLQQGLTIPDDHTASGVLNLPHGVVHIPQCLPCDPNEVLALAWL